MKAAYHTLGCKVNQYETEVIKEYFENAGIKTVPENEFADIYIVNTCSVTHLADRKSRQYIRRMKRINPDCVIAVTGCYAQVSKEDIQSMEEVDIIAGTNEKYKLYDYVMDYIDSGIKSYHIREYNRLNEYIDNDPIIQMEGRTRAYIKIQEGCNRFCSYCIIPYARGPVRSRKASSIINEAKELISKGYKEIVLTGINTALYGTEKSFNIDIDDNHVKSLYGIETIIYLLNGIDGDFRIRLSSLEPTVVNAEYVSKLLQYDKLCHHLHLSIQSGSNEVLKRMNRNYTREDYLKIVDTLKKADDGFGITTDIITGFPGETEEEFIDSKNIISTTKFLKVHVFQYSRREGTSAFSLCNQIDEQTKKERSRILIDLFNETSEEFIKNLIGTKRKVLFEEFDEEKGLIIGYTDNYIRTYCKADISLLNTFAECIITDSFEDGAFADIC